MLWFIIACAISILLYLKVKKSHSYWKERNVKYIEPTFLIGNMDLWGPTKVDHFASQLYFTHTDVRYVGSYQFLTPSLAIRDPELIKQIGVKSFDSFMNHRSFVPADVDPLWNSNIFTSTGARWRNLRSTVSPSFTGSKMKFMFTLMDECAQHFVKFFENKIGKHQTHQMEMKEVIARYTNDVIASTAFGIKIDSLTDRNNDFYILGKKVTNFKGFNVIRFIIPMISPSLSRLLNLRIIPEKAAKYFSGIIMNTIEEREKQHIVRPDMIHLLLQAQKEQLKKEEKLEVDEGFSVVQELPPTEQINKKITNDDIVAQAFGFFFAGFDTVSTAISFAFYELALNPDVQNRLREEILAVDGELTYEKLLGVKYLDMVVSEVLRLWPPTFMTERVVTKAFTIEPVLPGEEPLKLDVGMVCWIPQYAIQRDPKYYPEPTRFDPERFNDENKHKINPTTYLPFGIGPRNCMGSRYALLEIKLLLFHTLKSFEIVPTEKTPIPMVLDKFTVQPVNGMWLGLKRL